MKTPQNRHPHEARSIAFITIALSVVVAGTQLGCSPASSTTRPDDPVSAQAQEAEMRGRIMVRTGTDRSICDASLVFARNRLLGEQTGRPDVARRGRSVSQRLGRACLQRVARFWRSYQGCATPIAGREVETSVYWDADHAAAFRQYGLPQIASAIDTGRAHWQSACPSDFASVSGRESELAAVTPLPVPISRPSSEAAEAIPASTTENAAQIAEAPTAPAPATEPDPFAEGASLAAPSAAGYAEALEAAQGPTETPSTPVEEVAATPTTGDTEAAGQVVATAEAPAPADAPSGEDVSADLNVVTIEVSAPAVVFDRMARANELMSAGQYRQALRLLNSVRGRRPVPAVLFNMAVCLEHLGEFRRAAQVYNRVTADPVLGARAQQRVAILRHMPTRSRTM